MNKHALMAYIVYEVLTPITEKGTFTGKYVLFGDYIPSSLFVYETGAVLGYTFRAKMRIFVKLFCEPGREDQLISDLGDPVAARLASFQKEPHDFFELYLIPEITRLMKIFRDAGITKLSDWLDFPKMAKQKIRYEDVCVPIQLVAAEGIGLGSKYPELTERLFTQSVDVKMWEILRSHGLDVPPAQTMVKSMQKRQIEALSFIKPYITKAHPDLVSQLGL